MIDDVYFNGERLPRSNISSSSIPLSALIDTVSFFPPQFYDLIIPNSLYIICFQGSSLIRGPDDVIQYILNLLGNGGQYPCTHSHSLAFSIGGQLFPVDPRDFAAQALPNSVEACSPNIAATDPPYVGGYQFSWSLGIPFLKRFVSSPFFFLYCLSLTAVFHSSTLTTYYYGNLSYPSQDPPKLGFLSTVPSDASGRMQSAASAAAKANNNFPGMFLFIAICKPVDFLFPCVAVSEPAPTGSFVQVGANAKGVPQATYPKTISASHCIRPAVVFGSLGLVLLLFTEIM